MATGALPLGFSPLGDGDSGNPIAQLLHDTGRNRDDENLAFAAGLSAPTNGGASGGALANAFKAQSDLREKKDALMAQYIPLIQQAMVQQYESGMLGSTYGGAPQGQPQAQGQAAPADSGPVSALAPSAANAAPAVGSAPTIGGAPAGGGSFMDRVLNGTYAQAVQGDLVTGGRYGFAAAWKSAHEGIKHEGGNYYTPLTGGPQVYYPKIGENMAPDGKGGVSLAPGAAQAQGDLQYSTTLGQEQAKDQFAKPELQDTPGGTRLMTPAQQRAYATANAPGAAPSGMSNPGNMRPPNSSTGFAQFNSPEQGLAAIDKQLQIYGSRGINSVSKIVSTWAPPNENDTAAYIKDVSSRLGVKPDQPIDMSNPVVRQMLSSAIVLHEQGPSNIFTAPANDGPPGGVLRSPEQKKFAEAQAEQASTYKTALDSRVQQGTEMNMRLQEQLNALQNFRAGGGGETREQLAQMAQAIPGMPKWVVNGVAGGDLAAMQEFQKLAAQTAMEQLKQSMGGSGRVSQYEFKVFAAANPNLSTDPEAIKKVSDFNTHLYQRDLQEQKAFQGWIDSGRNPAAFQTAWQQELAKRGFTQPNMKADAVGQTMKTTGASPLSSDAITAELKRRGAIQ